MILWRWSALELETEPGLGSTNRIGKNTTVQSPESTTGGARTTPRRRRDRCGAVQHPREGLHAYDETFAITVASALSLESSDWSSRNRNVFVNTFAPTWV